MLTTSDRHSQITAVIETCFEITAMVIFVIFLFLGIILLVKNIKLFLNEKGNKRNN